MIEHQSLHTFREKSKNTERNYLEGSASTHCGDGHVGGGKGPTLSGLTPLLSESEQQQKTPEDIFPEPGIDS